MLVTRARCADRRLDECAPLFAALGDEVRLKLIETLSVGGLKSITELTAGMQLSGTQISRQGVSKHLSILAAAGWLRAVKIGRERLFGIAPAQLAEAHRSLERIGIEHGQALQASPLGTK